MFREPVEYETYTSTAPMRGRLLTREAGTWSMLAPTVALTVRVDRVDGAEQLHLTFHSHAARYESIQPLGQRHACAQLKFAIHHIATGREKSGRARHIVLLVERASH